jgi:undecaprenyl-diphosphatase
MAMAQLVPVDTPSVAASSCLHCTPPLTPAGLFGRRPVLLAVLGMALLGLAVAAWASRGWLLLVWDEPVQRFVEDARSAWATGIVRRISFLGSTTVVLALGCMLAAAAWRRCRAVAVVVIIAMLSRPLLEFTLKALVDRDRPDLERLVPGNGPSFPSGHVMAAVALWGLVPLVVGLYTRRPRVWWATVWASAVLIVLIGASRTYLGVHWFSDVVGGFIVGCFFLLGVELVLRWRHRRDGCGCACNGS